ncbi:hypothetical protein [Paraburkholderia sp. SIMBA_054]|uniref:hypothetical protein n=1 Tax=Paraburkholderia sp. SIMBA_054 TaxID=3085795 RepID=UPI0039796E2A
MNTQLNESADLGATPAPGVLRAFALAFSYCCAPVMESDASVLTTGRGWVSVLAPDSEAARELVERFFCSQKAINSFEAANQYRMIFHNLGEAQRIIPGHGEPYIARPSADAFHFVKQGRGGQVVWHSVSFDTLNAWEKIEGRTRKRETLNCGELNARVALAVAEFEAYVFPDGATLTHRGWDEMWDVSDPYLFKTFVRVEWADAERGDDPDEVILCVRFNPDGTVAQVDGVQNHRFAFGRRGTVHAA